MELLEYIPLKLIWPSEEKKVFPVFLSLKHKNKRTFDITVSLFALLLTLPVVFPVLMIWIILDAKGNAFFIQKRVGLHNKSFRCIKFRTMAVDSATGALKVTSVGRWLRPVGLDELPQLFNVLRGDMSLIGPRPHTLADSRRFEKIIPDYYLQRHLIRPGITGLAQSKGYKGTVSLDEELKTRVLYDLKYIQQRNLRMDLQIMADTLKQMFRELFRIILKRT